MFILLVFVFVSFLVGNESAFPANNEKSESVLRVKIFNLNYREVTYEDKKREEREDEKIFETVTNTEKAINSFLSDNHKIEQIVQTSTGAGTNNFMRFHTVITIFYKD